ncbi:lysophospholipase-like protein 1 [Strongylocentrotus purpuratus]|uniref:palmitoyl-protein hydrolase n=1 Tax=Strongylocentrotus purpuratus TaxID=7668 RepID=A0A7M7T4Z4_STRPU|nr:lysophospholipase-like protein 1 [Strongylocentrotus purpuratus]|eukprot:XP_785387.3 PREDICTED: lysophospholipase-like protein 1 [Strongylocentrotus purpuratus]
MTALARLKLDVIPASRSHLSSIIFLHGSGDTSEGLQEWLFSILGRKFCLPHSKVIFPSAPLRPYTPMNGAPSTVWFDRKQISQNAPEDLESVDPMCEEISKVIQQEVDQGIPRNKIIVGGFSMGGCLALHVAYRFQRELGGVFALSAFLNNNSKVYQDLASPDSRRPPLFQCHGQVDPLVLYEWGETTKDQLTRAGVTCQFQRYPRLYHEMNKDELDKLQAWIEQTLESS